MTDEEKARLEHFINRRLHGMKDRPAMYGNRHSREAIALTILEIEALFLCPEETKKNPRLVLDLYSRETGPMALADNPSFPEPSMLMNHPKFLPTFDEKLYDVVKTVRVKLRRDYR